MDAIKVFFGTAFGIIFLILWFFGGIIGAVIGVANDDVNSVSSFFGASLVGTGVVAARPDDQLGLAVAVAEIGGKGRQLIVDAGGDPANREINIELTYYADITEWLSLQPDLQWIIAPGGDEAVDDAFVAGLRLQLKNSWSVD